MRRRRHARSSSSICIAGKSTPSSRKGRVTSPETITNEPALLVPSAGSPYPAVVIDGLWLGNAIDDRLLQLAPALQKLKEQGLALQVPARLWGFLDGADFRSRVTIAPNPRGNPSAWAAPG